MTRDQHIRVCTSQGAIVGFVIIGFVASKSGYDVGDWLKGLFTEPYWLNWVYFTGMFIVPTIAAAGVGSEDERKSAFVLAPLAALIVGIIATLLAGIIEMIATGMLLPGLAMLALGFALFGGGSTVIYVIVGAVKK